MFMKWLLRFKFENKFSLEKLIFKFLLEIISNAELQLTRRCRRGKTKRRGLRNASDAARVDWNYVDYYRASRIRRKICYAFRFKKLFFAELCFRFYTPFG